jgi:hypothetical protein
MDEKHQAFDVCSEATDVSNDCARPKLRHNEEEYCNKLTIPPTLIQLDNFVNLRRVSVSPFLELSQLFQVSTFP